MVQARERLRVVIAALSLAASAATGVAADGTLTDTVYTSAGGPRYWSSADPTPYSRLDCSDGTGNPYWSSNGCTLTVKTQFAGCYWEAQTSSPDTAGQPSNCQVSIGGMIRWRATGAHCALASDPLGLEVSYLIGSNPGRLVSPILFQATAVLKPRTPASNGLATREYMMTIKAVQSPATASAGTPLVVFGSIFEEFRVHFTQPIRNECPNPDSNRGSIGAVRDWLDDLDPAVGGGIPPRGYVKADIVTL